MKEWFGRMAGRTQCDDLYFFFFVLFFFFPFSLSLFFFFFFFSYCSLDMIDLGFGVGDLDDEDDPDVLEDPLNQIDLKSNLQLFLQTWASNGAAWGPLAAHLHPNELQVAQIACSS